MPRRGGSITHARFPVGCLGDPVVPNQVGEPQKSERSPWERLPCTQWHGIGCGVRPRSGLEGQPVGRPYRHAIQRSSTSPDGVSSSTCGARSTRPGGDCSFSASPGTPCRRRRSTYHSVTSSRADRVNPRPSRVCRWPSTHGEGSTPAVPCCSAPRWRRVPRTSVRRAPSGPRAPYGHRAGGCPPTGRQPRPAQDVDRGRPEEQPSGQHRTHRRSRLQRDPRRGGQEDNSHDQNPGEVGPDRGDRQHDGVCPEGLKTLAGRPRRRLSRRGPSPPRGGLQSGSARTTAS